jgi:hypothetical protein
MITLGTITVPPEAIIGASTDLHPIRLRRFNKNEPSAIRISFIKIYFLGSCFVIFPS